MASVCLMGNPPGQKLQRQLQVVFQGLQLLNVTTEADIVKEESRTELLQGESTAGEQHG